MTAQVSSSPTPEVAPLPDTILAEVRNHIGHLTLNRPGGLNAINLEMVRGLQQQLDAWATDPQIKAVVLRGAGEKAFAQAVISARCTTAIKTTTPCTASSLKRNMPST